MSDSLTYEETAKKHFNIKITSEFSDDCIHYFYNILTADGYELFVSTKDPNNIELSSIFSMYLSSCFPLQEAFDSQSDCPLSPN